MSRLYYDAANPRMLSAEELASLHPAECAALCQQIDQNILDTLQKIDDNFVKSTRTVTDRLIPAVEGYGRSSKVIWDSVKLWKTFFEAAAGIRIGDAASLPPSPSREDSVDQSDGDHEGDLTARQEAASQPPSTDKPSKGGRTARVHIDTDETRLDASADADDFEDSDKAADGQSKHEPAWADAASPFEQLQADMQKTRIADKLVPVNDQSVLSAGPSSASFSMPNAPAVAHSQSAAARQKQQTRLRDLSLDSPDIERPALETTSFQQPRTRTGETEYNQQLLDASLVAGPKGKERAMHHNDYRNHASNPSGFFREGSAAPTDASDLSSAFDLSSIPPHSAFKSGGSNERVHKQQDGDPASSRRLSKPDLLQKLLKKKHAATSTPAKSKSAHYLQGEKLDFPEDIPKAWNGAVDLGQTSLSSFDSPQKRTYSTDQSRTQQLAYTNAPSSSSSFFDATDRSISFGGSARHYNPPPFSVGKSRLTKTPAKEAAKLITRDVLQRAALRNGGGIEDAGLESPTLDPPSVVKNWATRGYDGPTAEAQLSTGSPGKSQGQSRGRISPAHAEQLVEGSSFDAEFDDEAEDAFSNRPPAQPDFGHLADEGDEEALTRDQEPADDWGDSFDGDEDEDGMQDGDGFTETEVPLEPQTHHAEQDNDGSFDESRSFEEETVFGAKNPRQAAFRLKGAEDMVTIHGGNLLEAQPFEASPLAGRDARYGL